MYSERIFFKLFKIVFPFPSLKKGVLTFVWFRSLEVLLKRALLFTVYNVPSSPPAYLTIKQLIAEEGQNLCLLEGAEGQEGFVLDPLRHLPGSVVGQDGQVLRVSVHEGT